MFSHPPKQRDKRINKNTDQAESDVSIFFTDSYMIFQIKTITMYFRLVEGNYPDVSMLIPKEHQTEISVSTKSFWKG